MVQSEGVLADSKAHWMSTACAPTFLSRFFDNSYTVEFKSGRSVAVLECRVSRVSCDSLVLGAICETVVNFEVAQGRPRSPAVARYMWEWLWGCLCVGIASWDLKCSRSLIHWTSDVAPSSLGMVRGIDHGIVSWGAQLFVFKSTSRGPLFGDLAHAGIAS